MKTQNRWLLPKGVEEILPKEAWLIKQYERKILDLYHLWGYELVIPPMIEYQESLLAGLGADVDLLSFKMIDQLSGRTLAIRADITPQTARIDAHSWRKAGPTRLCYSGTVLHSKPKNALSSRTPIEMGAELYGDASVASDAEIINLMLCSIREADINEMYLDIGHVGIYRELLAHLDLNTNDENALFDAFDRKAETEIAQLLSSCKNQRIAEMLKGLLTLSGDIDVLQEARVLLKDGSKKIQEALDYLQRVIQIVKKINPDVSIMVDLSELRGYQYHTGLVFAAYINGTGHSIANGGRYDGIGRLFGRDRPATGFSINVNALITQIVQKPADEVILAPPVDQIDEELACVMNDLRKQGKRLAHRLTQAGNPQFCKKQLMKVNDQWQVIDL